MVEYQKFWVSNVVQKSPFIPIFSEYYSHFKADQGKDKEGRFYVQVNSSNLWCIPRQVELGKKVQGARTCQTDPTLIHLVSGNTSSVHGKEGDAWGMQRAVTWFISTGLLLIFYLLYSFTVVPSNLQSHVGRRPIIWISLSVCLGNATRLYHKVTCMKMLNWKVDNSLSWRCWVLAECCCRSISHMVKLPCLPPYCGGEWPIKRSRYVQCSSYMHFRGFREYCSTFRCVCILH